jgi:hypothetical protein
LVLGHRDVRRQGGAAKAAQVDVGDDVLGDAHDRGDPLGGFQFD